jgi:hypothetical protein
MAYERSVFDPAKPMTFSASRMQTWMSCNRKAGWQYIAGYEDPGTSATDFGGLTHAILESYKRDGLPINMMTEEGAVAAEAIPYVEDFRVETGARFEGEFTFQGRHKWRGAIDISAPGKVVDYKTTSNFKWAKTPEDLLHDPQAVLYAMKEFSRWNGDTVDLMWLYLRKKPRAAMPVRATITRAHATRAFAALEVIADEFAAAAAGAPASPPERHRYVLETLQPNFGHCSDYRGCPHISRCPQSPFFTNPHDQGKKPMNLLEQLQQMDAAAAAGTPLPAMRAESPPMLGIPAPQHLPGAVAPPPPPPPPPVVAVPNLGVTNFSPGFLASPDAPPSPPDLSEAEEERQARMTAALAAAGGALSAVEVTAGQINPPKRRGRPPGAKNKVDGTGPASPTLVGVPALSPVEVLGINVTPVPVAPPPPALSPIAVVAATPTPAPVPTGHRIGTLYVGCAPTSRGATVDFDALVATCKVAIGPAAYFAAYGYKANGMLLQMMEAVLQHEKPAAVVVAYPNAPEAVLCLSHLRSLSETVVEAIR